MACSCGGSCSDCRKTGGRARKRPVARRGGPIRRKKMVRGGEMMNNIRTECPDGWYPCPGGAGCGSHQVPCPDTPVVPKRPIGERAAPPTPMRKGGRARRRYNQGGYLQGPSHEQGGIPANIENGGQVELEGGEYIINAQTVNAVGTEFLDELNSTATTYHQGGYQPGQLPSPSNYKKGGRVKPKRKMTRGGKPPIRRKKQMGGGVRDGSCPPNQHWMPAVGNKPGYCMPGAYHGAPTNGGSNQYQRGGISRQNSQWVYFGTNDVYSGNVIQIGDNWFTTVGGGIEGNRKQVEKRK